MGYNSALAPSSSYASSTYSGIGGSPDRTTDPSGQVRKGTVTVKEEGFASFLWRPKWLVLTESQLAFHKTEVRYLIHF
jgi:serine/threonine-protein kinase CLA4